MITMRNGLAALAVCLGLGLAAGTQADPVLDGGWAYDTIEAPAYDSLSSPYDFTLAGDALFSISDCCTPGDTWSVYDWGTLILTTTFTVYIPWGLGDPTEWMDPAYSHGIALLGAGAHSLTVQGDCGGGCPAGFYSRLDSLPEPASIGGLLLGLVGLLYRRRAASAQ